MPTLRIGINGFGRIGRGLFRKLMSHPEINICAVNDVAMAHELIHLLKYDSIHGRLQEELGLQDDILHLPNGHHVRFTRHSQPDDIPWEQSNIDVVIEATGKHKDYQSLQSHLKRGVKKVILTAPPSDSSLPMFIAGVCDPDIIDRNAVFSCGSCTTHSAAPIIDAVDKYLGISSCYVTTVHSYTTDQRLQDAPHHDLRRSRAALLSMIPTSTGAARALTLVFPHLKDKIGGCGIRVPVPNVSLSDITFVVNRQIDIEDLNQKLLDYLRPHSKEFWATQMNRLYQEICWECTSHQRLTPNLPQSLVRWLKLLPGTTMNLVTRRV